MAILIEIFTFLVPIVVFILVIFVLVLVHELGHFIVARLSGMRVDEFGIGFPPRALVLGKIGDTEYTLNWLPLGGFVRIYGEDGIPGTEQNQGAFSSKPRILQALTLLAGIAMNVILAYVLIFASLVIGTQQIISASEISSASHVEVGITQVLPNGPGAQAGIKAGDIIQSATLRQKALGIGYNGVNGVAYVTLIASDSAGNPIIFNLDRNGKEVTVTATPKVGSIPSDPTRPGLGVSIATIGVIKTPWKQAVTQAGTTLVNETEALAVGLFDFFKAILILKPDFSQVSGPIGIESFVGQSVGNGLGAVLSLMGLISIDLALFNVLPIPALDGGRLLFVIIEAITRRPLNQKIVERINTFFFGLLILLIIVVSIHDVYVRFF